MWWFVVCVSLQARHLHARTCIRAHARAHCAKAAFSIGIEYFCENTSHGQTLTSTRTCILIQKSTHAHSHESFF